MTLLRQDRALLTAFREGQRQALERIYWHFVDAVTDVVRRGVVYSSGGRVTGVPAHDVGDLVQETFARAFREKARLAYDGVRDYRPYLMTICRNLLADWSRRRGREIPAELNLEAPLGSSEGIASGPDAEPEPWADPRAIAVLEEFVATLEPPLCEVYEQRFLKGASQAAAAEALGIGRQRIRTLEKRIRQGLAERLRDAC